MENNKILYNSKDSSYIDQYIKEDYNNYDENIILRKHFNSMTKEERVYLLSVKDKLVKRGITFAKHALDRMQERHIGEKEVMKALKNGQILEYKKTDNDEVIAVRGCHINKKNKQIYVIFSITQNKVITTYSNNQFVASKKMQNLEKYNTDFKIDIPDYYKNKIAFFYAL